MPGQPRRNPQQVDILENELVFDGFMQLARMRVRHERFDGGLTAPLEREVLLRRPAVAVLPYDPVRDRVALIEQFRIGAFADGGHAWLHETVAGFIDPGESALESARREAVEEAGVILGARAEKICEYYPTPGGCSERVEIWCAEATLEGGSGEVHGVAEEGEDIRVNLLAVEDAFAMLLDGRANSSPILISLLWLRLERARLRATWT
ncbi:NUDIX domain-containing protein [Marinibaculum pumilum]|uniref:ADP-ribose pyrophosphatase n=1 Tax=Marinibaculum pumilum TaxID=1766165 RepID=A0ABV7KWP8_9PROT